MSTKNTDTTLNVNDPAQLAGHLDAIRTMLDTIEEKIDPVPAPIPDTFALGKMFLSPMNEAAGKLSEAVHVFNRALNDYGMCIGKMSDSLPTVKNAAAWTNTMEKLRTTWNHHVDMIDRQLFTLGSYASFTAAMVNLACECDYEFMDTVLNSNDTNQVKE